MHSVQVFKGIKCHLLHIDEDMHVYDLDVAFDNRITFRLSRRWRKNDSIIKIFQIGVCCLKYQFVLGMFYYSCL